MDKQPELFDSFYNNTSESTESSDISAVSNKDIDIKIDFKKYDSGKPRRIRYKARIIHDQSENNKTA